MQHTVIRLVRKRTTSITPLYFQYHRPFLFQSFSNFQFQSSIISSTTSIQHNQCRRNFLSLPSLPSLPFTSTSSNKETNNNSSDPNDRQKHRERRRLKYPPEHVHRIVADVNNYCSFVPWCVESKITRKYDDNNNKHFDAELAVGFKMFVERYTSRVLVVPGVSVTATSNDTGLFQYLKTHWKFIPIENNPNVVDVIFEVDFEFKSKIYSSASAHFLDEVVREMVGAFERQCATIPITRMKIKKMEKTEKKEIEMPVEMEMIKETKQIKEDLPLSTTELQAIHEKFQKIVSTNEKDVMRLSQFKKLYFELFVHSSSESIEQEKQNEDNMEQNKKMNDHNNNEDDNNSNTETSQQQDIALVIKMGELMTRTVTESDLNHLAERHFHVMDIDNNGVLDVNEFIAGMGILLNGTVEQQWEHSFNIFDMNNDGYITKSDLIEMFNATSTVQTKMLMELLKYTRDQLIVEGHDNVAKQFQIDIDVLDQDGNEHKEGNGGGGGGGGGDPAILQLVNEIFDEVDIDKDNRINFKEFCTSEILGAEVSRLAAHKISFFIAAA